MISPISSAISATDRLGVLAMINWSSRSDSLFRQAEAPPDVKDGDDPAPKVYHAQYYFGRFGQGGNLDYTHDFFDRGKIEGIPLPVIEKTRSL